MAGNVCSCDRNADSPDLFVLPLYNILFLTGMTWIDWTVMLGTLLFIVGYGAWKTRERRDIEGFFLGNKQSTWWTIGLSVMATQASAITFLSTPGQAYLEGMGFVQFYFGLPLAMVIISIVFIPLYYRLKVFTAYEFLENRFDLKTRLLTAFLFLIQRGLAAGITIYAPAIILSEILSWSLTFTIIFIGVLVIIYTVSGGTKAVSQTHRQQMAVIFTGMFIAFCILVWYITQEAGLGDALHVAGKMGKMEVINTDFDLSNKYTLWTGILGGLFLQLSYFGTDQSQVQRYLSGQSVRESRLGLMFNGLVKVPMQFFILLTGVLVFLFYQFNQPPLIFNDAANRQVYASEYADSMRSLEKKHQGVFGSKKEAVNGLVEAMNYDQGKVTEASQKVNQYNDRLDSLRSHAKGLITKTGGEEKDDDYIFISWVINYLPIGLVGLLLAVIFSAAMSSTSAELNALASTTTVDMYKRNKPKKESSLHYLQASKWFTLLFGLLAITFAILASYFENLIEAVNILGSLFYGTILGIFLVAFFFKMVRGNAVFYAALISEVIVIAIFILDKYQVISIAYLWLNLIGCFNVILFSWILQQFDGGIFYRNTGK